MKTMAEQFYEDALKIKEKLEKLDSLHSIFKDSYTVADTRGIDKEVIEMLHEGKNKNYRRAMAYLKKQLGIENEKHYYQLRRVSQLVTAIQETEAAREAVRNSYEKTNKMYETKVFFDTSDMLTRVMQTIDETKKHFLKELKDLLKFLKTETTED